MEPRVGVRLLGGVQVERDGEIEQPGGRLGRSLLALLALRPGSPVRVDVLIDELWGESLPRNPPAALHVQVSRLRTVLDPSRSGEADSRSEVLRVGGGAYTLGVAPGAVDLSRFHQHVGTALNVAGPTDQLEHADAALAEFRGQPFAGCLPTPRLVAEREHIEERRLRIVERRIEALLAAGRAIEAVDAVLPAWKEHPDRERFAVLAVSALGAAGRMHDAARAYLAARRHLRGVGLEPGEELRSTYRGLVEVRAATARRTPDRRPIVGRDAILVPLIDALSGKGRLVVVEGAAGIGKSALLRAAVARADAGGARTAVGAWDEDGMPMAAWLEAMGELGVALDRAEPGAGIPERLAELAVDGPLLIVLDDAHRADSASLGVLRVLVRRGLPTGVVLLLAARTPDITARPMWDAVLADLVGAAGADDGASSPARVRLDELAVDAVDALARRALAPFGSEAAGRLGRLVWQRAGGHPLHVSALLAVLAACADEQSGARVVGEVPDSLRRVFAHQVDALPTTTRVAVEALAVLRPISLAGLADAVGVAPLALVNDLRPTVDAGLVHMVGDAENPEFRHDLVADAVRDAVPAATRAALHAARVRALDASAHGDAALAELLVDDGLVFTRLRHVVGARSLFAPREVAAAHRRAGVEAGRRSAAAEAIALFDAADVAEPDPAPGDAEEGRLHRALALQLLGRDEEADDLLDGLVRRAVAGGPPVADRAVIAALGDPRRGYSVKGDQRRLVRLRALAGVALAPAQRLRVLAALTVEETVTLGQVATPGAVPDLTELCAVLGAAADPTLVARVRWLQGRELVEAPVSASERLGAALFAHDLASAVDDPILRLDTVELLLHATLAAGDVQGARRLQQDLRARARRHHRPRSIWVASLLDAALALAFGETEAADELAAVSFALGQEQGVDDAAGTLQAFTMCRHWLTGTAPLLGNLPALAVAAYPQLAAWSAAAACAAAQGGRRDEAAERLAAARALRETRTARTFDRAGLALMAAAGFALDDEDAARMVLDDLPADPEAMVVLGVCAATFGPVSFFRGLSELVLGRPGSAREHFVEAETGATSAGLAPWAQAAQTFVAVAEGAGPAREDLPLGLGALGRPDRARVVAAEV